MKSIYDKLGDVQQAHRKGARQVWLDEQHERFIHGEIICDPDDPRTTAGLTDEEVAHVRGERLLKQTKHWLCGKVNCDCDEDYEDWRDSRDMDDYMGRE